MSSSNEQVRFTTPRGNSTIGLVVSRIDNTDIVGPSEFLVVDAGGSQYRIPEDEAEPI